MGLSKRSTLIAITVMAALSVEVGCGDGGSHKAPTRKGIDTKVASGTVTQPKLDASGNVQKDAKGNIIMETVPAAKANKTAVGPDGKAIMPKMTPPETDKNLKSIADYEAKLENRTAVPRDQITAGKYTLQSFISSVHITNTKSVNDETRAFQETTVSILNDQGVPKILDQTANKKSAGLISSYIDNPRSIDIATIFWVRPANGKWNPDRQRDATNVTLEESITSPQQTTALTDKLLNPMDLMASMMKIISMGKVGNDNTYSAVDENGVNIFVRLFQSDGGVTVSMSFEEKRDDGKDQQHLTMDRKIFFVYKMSADTKAASTADTTTHVTQVDTLPPNGPNGEAAPAAAPAVGQDTTGQ
ncbi:MAG: hypothetical protein ACXVA9_00985 [Bdellovibrionales bacterium]